MDLLLIDNSNVFIELKTYGLNARFDYSKFTKTEIKSKNLRKILVGSTPPKSDGFWIVMQEKGFEVYTYERVRNGEKGVDTKIVAEGVDHISNQTDAGLLVMMSGDLDMRALIEKAYKKGWEIVVWSWKDCISKEYTDGELSNYVSVKFLEDVANEYIFFDENGQREYLGERNNRLVKEKAEKEFKSFKENAIREVKNCNYVEESEKLQAISSIEQSTDKDSVNKIIVYIKQSNERLREIHIIKRNERIKKYLKPIAAVSLTALVGGLSLAKKFLSKK